MDGVAFPSQSYTPVGVPAAETAVPTPSAAVTPSPAAAVPAAADPHQTPAPAPQAGNSAFVPDFSSGFASSYVLDWRDPTTHAILVQVPMRTALRQFAEISGGAKAGGTVDTEA
jgi:hypothetical protein